MNKVTMHFRGKVMRRLAISLICAAVLSSAAVSDAAAKPGSRGPKRNQALIATRITTVSLMPDAIVARLTIAATNEGLDGKRVMFSFPYSLDDPASLSECIGLTVTRTPPTDPTSTRAEAGWAECPLKPTQVLAASFRRITASFAGDETYAPTSTHVSGYLCTGAGDQRTCLIET